MRAEDSAFGSDRQAARGATALTIAGVIAGAVNYAYTSGMGVLLPADGYSIFATAQAYLFVVGTIVSAAVPWFLAQRLAADPGERSTNSVLTFSIAVNACIAAIAAIAAVALIYPIGGPAAATATSAAVIVVSLGAVAVGLFLAYGRVVRLATLRVVEVALRLVAGIGLVLAGLGAPAAIGATAIGSLVFLAPVVAAALRIQWDWHGLRLRAWWRALVGHGAIQTGIALLATLDIILVAYLGFTAEETAGYQLSAALSRVPFYFALALALAAFSGWVRRGTGGGVEPILGQYLTIAIPSAFVVGSLPGDLLNWLYPDIAPTMDAVLLPLAIGSLFLGAATVLLVHLQVQNQFGGAVVLASTAVVALVTGALVARENGPEVMSAAVVIAAGIALLGSLYLNERAFDGIDFRGIRPPFWTFASPVLLLVSDSWFWYVGALLVGLLVAGQFVGAWGSKEDHIDTSR